MGNFGSNFLRGFQPTFARSFDTSFKYGIDQQEEERKRKEMLKAEQEQQGIMSQITRGSINPPKLVNGKFEPQGVSYPNAGDFNLRAGLTADNRNLMEYWDKLNAPKEQELQKTVTIGNDVYLQSPLYDNVPVGEKLYTKPEEKVDFEYKKANEFSGLEDYPSDYKVAVTKKNGVVTAQSHPFSYTQQKIDVNINQPYTQLSDYSRNNLDDYVKEIDGYNKILSQKPDPVTGKYKIYDKYGIPTAVVSEEAILKAKQNITNAAQSFLDNNGGQAIDDYRGIKTILGKNPKSLWKSIYEAYIKDLKDEKDDAWFQTAKYQFQVDFGFDPVSKYHLGGSTKTVKR